MNEVYKAFVYKFVLVFYDDIFIHGKSIHEHNTHVAIVSQTLSESMLGTNWKKYDFGVMEVTYLGQAISVYGSSRWYCKNWRHFILDYS